MTTPDPAPPPLPALKPEAPPVRSREAVVLVVEDNPVTTGLTVKVLDLMHLASVPVATGEQALAWCRDHLPLLILMDLSLPELSGIEVTRRLRAIPDFDDIPILAFTAHGNDRWAEEACLAGCADFLSKPVRPRDLMDAVQRHLKPR